MFSVTPSKVIEDTVLASEEEQLTLVCAEMYNQR
jgi:hypothetical protein